MATRDWPTGPQWQPQTVSWGARVPTSGWAGFYSGQRQRVAHLGHRQVVTLTLPAWRDVAQAAAREAWLQSLVASGDLVRLRPWHRLQPLGSARGSLTVAVNAAAGASELRINGALVPPNLLRSPQQLSSADWVNAWGGAALVTPDSGAAPDGTLTADLLQSTAGVSAVAQSVAVQSGVSYTWQAWIFVRTGPEPPETQVQFQIRDGSGGAAATIRNANFAVSSGVAYSLTHTWVSDRTATVWVGPLLGTAGRAGVFVWGQQFEAAAAASAYSGSPALLAGDFLAVGSQLVQVGPNGAQLNASGQLVVPLALPLRRAVTAGASVDWVSPTATCELAASEMAAAYTPGLVQQPLELTFVEAF